MLESPVLKRFVDQVVFAVNPHGVVLFGSHARGTAKPTSDVDLLVVWDTELPAGARAGHVEPLAADYAVQIDVVVRTPAELAEQAARPHSFTASALRTGKVVYRRDEYEFPVPA